MSDMDETEGTEGSGVPVAPHRVDGETIEPNVSVPSANGTRPAAVADAEPADEPLDP